MYKRQVKVGTVFTHRKPDPPDQRPERDYNSTTYVADIIPAQEFGSLLRAEALRRGIAKARVVVFLEMCIRDRAASQDLLTYAGLDIDARQIQRMILHLAPRMARWRGSQGPVFSPAAGDIFSVSTDGTGAPMRRKELRGRKALLKDKIAQVIAQAKEDLPIQSQPRQLAKKQIAYFERNRSKMMYQTFRQAGYFIGSGVVEAGCKTLVGQRLKRSGMLWSRNGARQLLTVRCALLSRLFDDFWKHHNNAGQTLAFAK